MTELFIQLNTGDELVLTGIDAVQKLSLKLLARLVIDLLSAFILIRFVYFKIYKRSDLFFTFFIFNIVIFLICFLLNKVDLSMGAAFGLFAVFSMLRYRTEDISIKDMTYIFLLIAIGLINAVAKIKGANDAYEFIFIAVIDLIIILLAYLLESKIIFKKEAVQQIVYDNIELIKEGNKTALLEDLKNRTGLNIHRISIGKIDYLKDATQIKVYYYES